MPPRYPLRCYEQHRDRRFFIDLFCRAGTSPPMLKFGGPRFKLQALSPALVRQKLDRTWPFNVQWRTSVPTLCCSPFRLHRLLIPVVTTVSLARLDIGYSLKPQANRHLFPRRMERGRHLGRRSRTGWSERGATAYVVDRNGDYTVTTPFRANTTIDFGEYRARQPGNACRSPTYYTPFIKRTGLGDADLGSGGVLVVPDQAGPNPHILIQALS